METLAYGFLKPQNGDKGQQLFDDLADNVQQTNDHTHDGINSAKVNVSAITKQSQLLVNTNWVSPVGGVYNQVVSMVVGLLFDSSTITIRETSTGKLMPLLYEKVDSTSFRVYCNDATKDLTILYA